MPDRELVRIGLIGAGNIAVRHVANLKFLGGNEIAAICDKDISRAKQLANGTGAKVYDDFAEMTKREDLDAVMLLTPPSLRKPVFELAAEKNIAVFCEKPPARTLDEAKEIADIADRADLLTSVGFNCRYAPSVDYAKQLLAGKEVNFARVAVISSVALPGSRRLDDWFFRKEVSGGLIDVLIHELDLLIYIIGKPVQVHCIASNLVIPKSEDFTIEDTWCMNIRFESGAGASVVSSWACSQRLRDFTLFGEDFSLSLTAIPPRVTWAAGKPDERPEKIEKVFPQGPPMGRSGKIHPDRKPTDPPDPPHFDEVKAFVETVRTGDCSGIRCTYRDSLPTTALVDAIDRSIESGQAEELRAV